MIEIDNRDKPDPGRAAVTSRPARDSVRGSHDGGDGTGEIAVRDFPAGPEPGISRPSTAPAYYLGRPARLWITVMRPRRRRTHPITRCKPSPAAGNRPITARRPDGKYDHR